MEECERWLGAELPHEYVEFLTSAGGGEGLIGETVYVILWGADELRRLNEAYEVQRYAPGLLVFGSNGGGEAYGFDTRSPDWHVVEVPLVGMTWDLAKPMGATFLSFLGNLYNTKHVGEPTRPGGSTHLDCRGKEIFEPTPVLLGGSPTDPANKVVLNRKEHIEAVVYWNKVIAQLREEG
jgi:hypothetical protein